jgi:Family of unknown function (DUF6152)
MNKLQAICLTTLALLMSSAPLIAHHGTASNYDQKKRVKVEGVVKEFWWRNPGAPAALINSYGYSRSTFKPGDHVVIHMWPSYATPTNGQLDQSRIWVNGKELLSKNGKG